MAEIATRPRSGCRCMSENTPEHMDMSNIFIACDRYEYRINLTQVEGCQAGNEKRLENLKAGLALVSGCAVRPKFPNTEYRNLQAIWGGVMELRQLKYFIAVAEELHFGRAAERVHISQPPLSMQIRNLETELGVQLLRRTSRSVELTEAGAFFLQEANSLVQRLDEAVSKARRIERGEAGTLSIGFVGPAMDVSLPDAIREFRSEHPGVCLDLFEMVTREQFEALASGDIQIGFMRLYGQGLRGFAAELVVREPYVLALPAGHRLDGAERVGLDELKGEPLVFFPRGLHPELYDAMFACFKEAGFSPNVVQEVKTKKTTLSLVAAGIGLAIVPESSATLTSKGIQYRPIMGNLPKVEIFAVREEKRATALMDKFMAVVRKHRSISP